MKSVFKPGIIGISILLFAFAFLLPSANADNVHKALDFTKTIKKEFPISATGNVSLSNRYGKVDVKTWDKNRVKIDITIIVKASSESAAQNVFDRIRVDFTNTGSYVKAETSIESSKSSWWNWGSSSNSEFQINYEVFMPSAGSLDLTNKYGNSTVAPIGGKANVNVKYGDFRLEDIGGNLSIVLGYGNGTVIKARDVNADVSYSRINFNAVQDITMSTKYSKITVENAGELRVESSYDNYNISRIRKLNHSSRYGNVDIGSVESVIAQSKYTDYKIDKLSDAADFNLQYGGLNLNTLSRGFSNINLVGKYTDFKIYVENNANYMLDAVSNYAGITYPSGFQVTYEKDKGTSHEVRGHYGSAGARSTIKASINYGGLKIRQ